MYREIEEAVAFVAAYFYYKLPRNQVDQFAVKLANALLNSCRKIIDADGSKVTESNDDNDDGDNNDNAKNEWNPEMLTREIVLDINVDGKLAVAIVEAASVFRMALKRISALLPNAVQLRISEGMVSYSFRSNLICLYRSDGNMYHLHRQAHHTHLRPPLTILMDDNNRKVFQLITKEIFPRRRYCLKKNCTTMNNSTQLRKVMKSAYFRRNNQQLPGPTRSAKLSGNGFMHPSLPPGYGRRWKGTDKSQESTLRKGKNERRKDRFRSKKKENLNALTVMKSNSPNSLNQLDNYRPRNSSKDNEMSSTFVTDDMLRSFGVLASDFSHHVNETSCKDVSSLIAYMNRSLNI